MLLSICESAVLLLLCFYLLRLLGQGAIMLVSQNAINLWFVRLRGLVMGIAAAGASMGGVQGARTRGASVGWEGAPSSARWASSLLAVRKSASAYAWKTSPMGNCHCSTW